MQNKRRKKILISPLDWGLGHASRIIPVIKFLQKNDNEIIIAANNNIQNYLKTYFPDCRFVDIPSYGIKYSQKHLILSLILQIPKIIKAIKREHKFLGKIIKTEKIDCVISDNRYGLWDKNITSVFITHQINIKLPKTLKLFEKLLYKKNKKLIERFDYCLIPDEVNSVFTGELTNKYPLPKNVKFIGLLSRFSDIKITESQNTEQYDVFIILSGAEPQKTEFMNLIIKKFINTDYKVLIVAGNLSAKEKNTENIKILPHLSDTDFVNVVQNASFIISRSGYSTIMDLTVLKANAILIPTPGQTEQEYLAKNNNDRFYFISQDDFINIDLKKIKLNSDIEQ